MGEFDDTIGALLIGQIVSTFLYGLGTLQTYIYYAKYPKDGRELKVWVGAIWMIDTVNVALVCHGLYFVIYGKVVRDQEKADMGIRTFDISSGFNVLVAILVQCFFVKRIYQLCQVRMRHFLSLFLTALVLAHFALGSTAVVKVINALNSSSSLASLAFSAGLPYTLAAVLSDTSISITLIILLSSRRSEFESINSIINRAINFSLSRCLLVSIVAIGRLVTVLAGFFSTFTVSPKTAWFLAMDFAMGKLYANSLLAMLNSRRSPSISASESDTQTADTNPVFTTVMDMPSSWPTTSSAFTSSTPQRAVDLERSQGTVKDSTHTIGTLYH